MFSGMGEHTFDTRMDRIVAVTGELDGVTLSRLEDIAALDQTREYLADGYTSVPAFLVHRCGMGTREANRQMFLARALKKAPYAAKLVTAVRLTVNQFEVLAHAQSRHPEPYESDEPTLCEAVTGLTLPDTKRLVEYWCRAHDDPTDDAIDPSRVFLAKTFAGRGRLDGDLTPEDHALLAAALDTLLSEIVEATPRDELLPMPELRAQALAEVARRHLDSPDTPQDHGNRPHLTVVVDWEVLKGTRRDKTSEFLDGTVITPSAVQRLACDAAVSRLLTGPAGEILDLGRSRRTVTAAQWKALRLRDRHCQFRTCRRPLSWCDAHHITPWSREDGPTDLCNLVLLCRYHHTLIHDGGWRLTGTPGNLTIARPDGTTPPTRAPP
jgi:hypothetical protein